MIRKRKPNCNQRSTLRQKCINLRTLKQVHASVIINGFNSNRSALTELLYMSTVETSYTIHYAHQLLASITQPDLFMWNAIIRGSAQSNNPLTAVSLYTQMEKQHIMKHGFESNTFLGNMLIYFRATCGDIRVASSLFYDSAKSDVVPWSALTAGYARRGQLNVARKLFDEMPVKDLVSWKVMITVCAKRGKMECARELFDVVPKRDVVTWNAMILGYVFWALDVGDKMHSFLLEMDVGYLLLGNALIDMYAKCGSIEKALEVFWGRVGLLLLGVLAACSHAGKVEEGHRYFKLMTNEYNMEANKRHYGCMVDMLGRAGLLLEAFHFVDTMEIEPNSIIWRMLLGACRIHGNMELGKHANEQLLKLRHNESGDYVLLSNIYASRCE
ncbi:hypothetical protein LguiB_019675 [Lonicera macranthoides]